MTATALLEPLPYPEDPNVVIVAMLTPGQAADLFIGDITRRGYSDRTVDTYRRILYKLCDRLPPDYHVGQITTDDCRRFLDQWNRHSAGTRVHTFSVLASFMEWLVFSEKIKRSPLATMSRPKRSRPDDLDVVTITPEGVRQLFEAANTWTEKLAVAIPAYIGPRRHAVSQLRLRDYDTVRARIRFREKGGKVIWKPVPKELAEMLSAAMADGAIKEPDDYLVPPEGYLQRAGGRDDRVIWRVVKRVADRAGVDVTVHALRAAFACFYLESNPGDTYGLKELLGHVSFETTNVYLRKLDKGTAMERVRDLSWTTPTPPKPIVDDGYVDEPASWVYFIAAGDVAVDGTPVKIGWAGDPQARLSDLQSGHHAELVLVAAVPGGVGLEAHFHAELAADRLRGEWFSSSPSLRGLIASSQTRMDRGLAANLLTEASRLVGVGGFEPPKDDGRHVERAGDQSRPAEVDQ